MKAWLEDVSLLSYLPASPDRNPLFLEKRVYQGSSGRVYPLPCIDRIASDPVLKNWNAVHLENEYIRVMILPEIGGRVHVGLDKVNGYDFFYRQNVIKPALVGLTGPWISGGVEFNWPQHHRPSTFMPVEVEIERASDGSVTVWCSEHDPMQRMKGMHGVTLHPGRALIELKVRLYNRTQVTQTFLWWANAATRVHERYQSFFPPDVRYVADHAKRAITSYPLSDRPYYGVDYAERSRSGVPEDEAPPQFRPNGSYAANDLSWYANIPVPTSYMITGSSGDFFGGYDHAAEAGVVHVANHHIAPGKKQWTWGNHEFGYAWDRSLTDEDGPYIELMAGVYTDNQPDFSYLAPGETKVFSQFWYPIRKIGTPVQAGVDAAFSLRVEAGRARLGVTITRDFPDARLTLSTQSRVVEDWAGALSIREPLMLDIAVPPGTEDRDLIVELYAGGKQILRYSAGEVEPAPAPELATEPPEPSLIENMETLYLTGVHLEQYRHATRAPEPYWQEALRRDPGDSRSNMALGRWHLRRGELHAAEKHIRRSIQRLTERNPNPADGEPFYYLGLVLRLLGRSREAYDAFYKSIWNAAWKAPGYLALTEIDVAAGRWEMAAEHVQLSLRADEDCNHASSLQYLILNHLGRTDDAVLVLGDALRRDPLDIWFRYLAGQELPQNAQQCIDLALDCMRAGLLDDAATGLRSVNVDLQNGAGAIALYLLAQMSEEHGDFETARKLGTQAAAAPPEYVFPHRIEEMLALEAACARNHSDARAPYYLGNYLYSFGRYSEAIDRWETATRLDPAFPTAWRNLGLALYNIRHDENTALDAFDRAFRADPRDARVFYERDQLWKRAGYSPEQRLAELRRYPELVRQRDDLSIEFVTLLNDTGLPEEARALLAERHFQPWEGGEGLVLAQFVRTHLLLGRRALAAGDPDGAVRAFREACHPWKNLSEAKHLLANSSELDYWLGVALAASGDSRVSVQMFERAARQRGDFQKMSVRAISEMTYWAAMAELKLGHKQAATNLFEQILACSFEREREPAKTDYFATSLPTMLLFEEDLEKRKDIEAWFLRAQAFAGLGRMDECRRLLQQILDRDRNHAEAADLLSNLETTVHS